MKAIECTKYGAPDVLKIITTNKPAPRDNEVLVKVYATTVTSGESRIRGFLVPAKYRLMFRFVLGFNKPRKSILGSYFAGEVEATGQNVTNFKNGDFVFGSTGMGFGTYAEFVTISENGLLIHKPNNISFEEAAAIPFGGTSALYFLKKAKIQKGHKVLIYGASGAVGTAAIQLAKYYGAEVTGVCSSSNVDLVKSLGANYAIDYKASEFINNGKQYDIIFDAVGLISKNYCKKSLTSNGTFVSVLIGSSTERKEDFIFLKELAEQDKIKMVIDRSYPLEQIPEAHGYVEQGHKKGNVAISVASKE